MTAKQITIDAKRLKAIVADSEALAAAQRDAGHHVRDLRKRLSELRGGLNPGGTPLYADGKPNAEKRASLEKQIAALQAEIAAAEETQEEVRDKRSLAGKLSTKAIEFANAHNQLPANMESEYGLPRRFKNY